MNPALKEQLAQTMSSARLFALAEWALKRRGSFIFSLHRVLPCEETWQAYNPTLALVPESLDAFLKFLAGRFPVVPLAELVAHTLKHGKTPVCALTFDDGWEDNYRVAFPILRNHGVPATIFLPTELIGNLRLLPEERLSRILRGPRWAESMEILRDRLRKAGHLGEDEEIFESRVLQSFFKNFSFQQKMDFLELGEKMNELGPPDKSSFLTWDQAREMQRYGVTFGSHTTRHGILSVNPVEFMQRELSASKQQIEQELGVQADFFAYPNGMYNPAAVGAVQEAGYRAAFTTARAPVTAASNPFLLPRVPLSNDMVNDQQENFSTAMAQLLLIQTYFSKGQSFAYWAGSSVYDLPATSVPQNSETSSVYEKDLTGVRMLYMIDEMVSLTAGGTERQILQIAKLMQSKGASVEICLLRGTEWLNEEFAGTPVHFAGIPTFKSRTGLLNVGKLVSWMRSRRFHIVQTFFVESNLLGPLLARFAGVPIVLGSRRNLNYWMSPRVAFLQRLANLFTTRLLANCEAVKRVVVDMEKVSPEKVDVLYNGVDLEELTPDPQERQLVRRELGVSGSDLLIGSVSTLRSVKGADTFVEAAALLHRDSPSAKFVLVGDGPLRSQLEAIVNEAGLSSSFVFAGSQVDVRRYLRAFDVAVLSSDSEGFSNSILEYAAMGLPCVVTDVGGNAEAMGPAGLLVPTKDPAALAGALRSLSNDSSLRANYARAALAHSRRFSLPETRSKLTQYYLRLLRDT